MGMRKIVVGALIVIALGAFFVWYTSGSRTTSVADTISTSIASNGNSTPPPSTQPTQTTALTPSTGAFKDGSSTGTTADAFYGPLQVQATISGGKLVNIAFLQYPSDQPHSVEVSNMALPQLKQEAIAIQSAQVHTVSGASQTSEAFRQSLSSALSQAK